MIAGAVCIVIGAALIAPAAGWITAGVVTIALAVVLVVDVGD